MTEAEWRVSDDPAHTFRPVCGTPRDTTRRRRLYAHACCCRTAGSLPAPLTRDALEGLERYADGRASEDDLAAHRAVMEARLGELGPLHSVPRADEMAARTALAVLAHALAPDTSGDGIDRFGELVQQAAMYQSLLRPTGFPTHGITWEGVLVRRSLSDLLRDIFGNPFRPVEFPPEWRTDTAIALARQMYDAREFSAMPILADALQDAGCDNDDILNHCRGPGPHVRGCWVVDLVLGKG